MREEWTIEPVRVGAGADVRMVGGDLRATHRPGRTKDSSPDLVRLQKKMNSQVEVREEDHSSWRF